MLGVAGLTMEEEAIGFGSGRQPNVQRVTPCHAIGRRWPMLLALAGRRRPRIAGVLRPGRRRRSGRGARAAVAVAGHRLPLGAAQAVRVALGVFHGISVVDGVRRASGIAHAVHGVPFCPLGAVVEERFFKLSTLLVLQTSL